MAGSTVTFAKGGTTLTLPGPAMGGKRIVEKKRQTVGRTQGGNVRVHDQGVDTFEAEVSLESLTEAQKINLQDFFDNLTYGASYTFTYTDEAGTAFTARFLNPTLQFTVFAYNVYDVSLMLELSAMGA